MILPREPVTDAAAWEANPDFRWVYDRLVLAQTCGVRCAPAGVEPPEYPVIWKPIVNLWGMGRGAFVANGPVEYQPGFMWSEVLVGRHISTDAVLKDGVPTWTAQALGISDGPSRFSAWFLGDDYELELATVRVFCSKHLGGYSGPLNVETIGGRIIEAHLRLTADWVDAGAYEGFPGCARRMVGIPVFRAVPTCLPGWIGVGVDDGDPRHAFLTMAL